MAELEKALPLHANLLERFLHPICALINTLLGWGNFLKAPIDCYTLDIRVCSSR